MGVNPFDDTEQLALFEPPSGDEAHETNTVTEAQPDHPSRSACCFCGRGVSLEDPATHEEITSWVHGKKKDSAVLRTRSGRLACGDCIAKMRAGLAIDQQDYETLLDSDPARSDVDSIFSDRSPDYTLGYERGRSGSELLPPGPVLGNATALDYLEGYSDGEEERIAKERLGTPLSQQNEMPEV